MRRYPNPYRFNLQTPKVTLFQTIISTASPVVLCSLAVAGVVVATQSQIQFEWAQKLDHNKFFEDLAEAPRFATEDDLRIHKQFYSRFRLEKNADTVITQKIREQQETNIKIGALRLIQARLLKTGDESINEILVSKSLKLLKSRSEAVVYHTLIAISMHKPRYREILECFRGLDAESKRRYIRDVEAVGRLRAPLTNLLLFATDNNQPVFDKSVMLRLVRKNLPVLTPTTTKVVKTVSVQSGKSQSVIFGQYLTMLLEYIGQNEDNIESIKLFCNQLDEARQLHQFSAYRPHVQDLTAKRIEAIIIAISRNRSMESDAHEDLREAFANRLASFLQSNELKPDSLLPLQIKLEQCNTNFSRSFFTSLRLEHRKRGFGYSFAGPQSTLSASDRSRILIETMKRLSNMGPIENVSETDLNPAFAEALLADFVDVDAWKNHRVYKAAPASMTSGHLTGRNALVLLSLINSRFPLITTLIVIERFPNARSIGMSRLDTMLNDNPELDFVIANSVSGWFTKFARLPKTTTFSNEPLQIHICARLQNWTQLPITDLKVYVPALELAYEQNLTRSLATLSQVVHDFTPRASLQLDAYLKRFAEDDPKTAGPLFYALATQNNSVYWLSLAHLVPGAVPAQQESKSFHYYAHKPASTGSLPVEDYFNWAEKMLSSDIPADHWQVADLLLYQPQQMKALRTYAQERPGSAVHKFFQTH